MIKSLIQILTSIIQPRNSHFALLLIPVVTGFFIILVLLEKREVFVPSSALCKDCNVILITMTNLRYDHMSFNGYERPTTPRLDALAKESVVFDNAFSHASWTLPEGISMYTSLYPYQHGVMSRSGETLFKGIPTIIDVFNKAGYQTVAITGRFDYNLEYGMTDRFSHYEECQTGEVSPRAATPIKLGQFSCVIPKTLRWLMNRPPTSPPFFLHIQAHDAHCPFSQNGGKMFDPNYKGKIDYSDCLWTFDRTEPVIKNGEAYYPVYSRKTGTNQTILLSERDIEHLVALYDESIADADARIGFFLDDVKRMGLLDNTIIIFTSEHGDMLGKHGRLMRGGPLRGTFYDDVLHIPLFIRHPKLTPKRLDALAGHVDLAPTILSFLGLPSLPNQSGKSLIPAVTNNQEVNEYVFAGSEFTPSAADTYFSKRSRIEAIRNKEWKLIKETIFDSSSEDTRTTIELYDIGRDNEELTNVAGRGEFRQIQTILEGVLDSWSDRMRR